MNRIHINRVATTATRFAVLAAALALIGSAPSRAARLGPPARAARSLNGTATAHLHLIRPNGAQLYEEGPVTGALPGWMHAVVTTGSVVTGSFDISTRGGKIDGRGTATPHGTGRYQSFSGTLAITGGSGRYAHAHGRAGLYGTFDRRTYALVIQTTGRFSY
jgi:hypothetical protein